MINDDELLKLIKEVLNENEQKGFYTEGYKKVDARLKVKHLTAAKERVRRVMGENDLLCPQRQTNPRGPKNHDGTIIPLAPNNIWGTDMTTTYTRNNGKVHVWAVIDHHNSELLGIHVSKSANRYQAMEPISQAVSNIFLSHEENCAKGILIRHDHGSQYMSNKFQNHISHFGMVSSPSFVRTPEGNGVIERFFRTLKENCLWLEISEDIESLQERLNKFMETYNNDWILHRLGFKTPRQVRENWVEENDQTAA